MVGGRKQNKKALRNAVRCTSNAMIEAMEARQMLSSTPAYHPDYTLLPSVGLGTVIGYTPAQIRTAYGFNDVSFGDGTVPADGSGQTIAIVDAYNDPNIVSDLTVFDAQFDLPAPPSLQVVNQTGGSTLPATDGGWAGEISLDVEYVHAIAPKANLLLVEATDASIDPVDNLVAAVNYARTIPAVSVVSMSWGGSEFVDTNLGESNLQLAEDSTFTTPAGHQGVTFVASAGDSGSAAGVQFPSSSPNVISVGGTNLALKTEGNAYNNETGWNGTNGGFSQVETAPAYQALANTTANRADPDVSYDADPDSGFAVYDTVSDAEDGNPSIGWEEVGGTSAGAPQWAALVAIADQGRVLNGLTTLDGPSQTLPDLYSVYAPPSNVAGYTNYLNYFHDVTSGGGGEYQFRWGGSVGNGITSGVGYDEVTGLGSPHAANIVNLLAANTATVVDDGSTGTVDGGGATATGGSTASTRTSPIQIAFITNPQATVLNGDVGTIKLQVTNTGSAIFSGPFSIALYASPDGTVSTAATVVNVVNVRSAVIKPSRFKIVLLKFHYSEALANGSYHLVASVQASGTNSDPGVSVPSTQVNVVPANVDLATTFVQTTPAAIRAGKPTSVLVRIENLGNVTAIGSLNLSLYSSTTGVIDVASTLLTGFSNRKIKLGAGRTMTFRLTFVPTASQVGGTFSLIASATSTTQLTDSNAVNNTAVLATAGAA